MTDKQDTLSLYLCWLVVVVYHVSVMWLNRILKKNVGA